MCITPVYGLHLPAETGRVWRRGLETLNPLSNRFRQDINGYYEKMKVLESLDACKPVAWDYKPNLKIFKIAALQKWWALPEYMATKSLCTVAN